MQATYGLGGLELLLVDGQVLEREAHGVAHAVEQLGPASGASDASSSPIAQHEQVTGEVARVHGRDVGGAQRLERPDVVPVVEVTAEPLEAGHRRERRRDVRSISSATVDVAEVVARRGRRAAAGRCWWARCATRRPRPGPPGSCRARGGGRSGTTKVSKNRQVLRATRRSARPRCAGERFGRRHRARLRDPPGAQGSQQPQQRRAAGPPSSARRLERGAEHEQSRRREAGRRHRPPEGLLRGARAPLDIGGGLPLEQVLARDEAAPDAPGRVASTISQAWWGSTASESSARCESSAKSRRIDGRRRRRSSASAGGTPSSRPARSTPGRRRAPEARAATASRRPGSSSQPSVNSSTRRRRDERSPQVVGDLPAVQAGERVGLALAAADLDAAER